MTSPARNIRVKHKFFDHKIHPDTRILIIGTFNPGISDSQNNADFFYSRQRRRHNELWKLLTTAFGCNDLTGINRVDDKKLFMKQHHIDFVDLIKEIEVPAGCEGDVKDAFIDKRVTKWTDVISLMQSLKLDAACFTRSTFKDIPNINSKVIEIEHYCKKHDVIFKRLVTPSPAYRSQDKQREWTLFFKPFQTSKQL
jgi:G:T/U-mismatch repair DNA glycosylase